MECAKIVKTQALLEGNRQVVEQQWDIIRKYVVPFRGHFFKDQTTESSVEWRENRDVFDSTAIDANNTLASSLHGAITNPMVQWFSFYFQDNDLNDNREAAEWAYNAAAELFRIFRDSNFNLEANESYIDLTSFGTSFIIKEVEEENNQFMDFIFASIPVVEGFFKQDYRGRIVEFYRKMRWSPTMIVDKFGPEGLDDKIVERAKSGDNEMDITIIFAIYKRELGVRPDVTGVMTPENRPYGYKYVMQEGAKMLGEEGGYYTMPVQSMRWRKTADSMWGNSPAMTALPDILTLNELVELILNSLEKVVDPAIVTTERGLLSQLDLGAAGVNVVRSMGELEPFESRARFDVAGLEREKLQHSIRKIFYVDQLELKDSPAMTATEVQVRYELMQRLLGPTLGRLESDFLDPLVMSALADLMRYGRIPPPPQSVMEAGNPRLLISYTGPMARAQKLDQAASVERFLASMSALAEIKPEALDKIDADKMVENLSKYYQIDPDNLVPQARVNRTRNQREQLQARGAEAEVSGAEADAQKTQAETVVSLNRAGGGAA